MVRSDKARGGKGGKKKRKIGFMPRGKGMRVQYPLTAVVYLFMSA